MSAKTPIAVTCDEGIQLVGEIIGPVEAPLVMLLHGGGQTRHSWSVSALRLRQAGFAVGSYDARGHGDSGWSPSRDYALDAHARDLVEVMRVLDRPAAFVGASMGGISGLLAASITPEYMNALVLVDIVPNFASGGVERVRAFMTAHPDGFASVEEAAAAVQAYNPNRARSSGTGGLMRSLRESADGRLHWHWDPAVISDPPSEGLAAQLADELASLPKALPLLLVSGEQSDVVDGNAVRQFREMAPHAEVVVVGHAGHMVAGDRNDRFTDAVVDFLSSRLSRVAQ